MKNRKNHRNLGLLLAAALIAAPAGAEESWDEPTKKWIKGPVSYLVTDEEAKEFKQLGKEDERAKFIEEFWGRRDPRPETEQNEFRQRFYGRVESADETMKAQGVPAGWKSEPARVLILLGQPADVKQSAGPGGGESAPESASAPQGFETGGGGGPTLGGASGGGATLTFVYPDLSGLGLPANLEIVFQQQGLAYSLLTRVDLSTPAVRGLDPEALADEFPAGADPVEEKITLTPTAPPTPVAPAGVGSIQRQVLEALLDDAEVKEDVPLEASIDLYKALAGQTYVAITLGLPVDAVESLGLATSDLHPIAALQHVEDPEGLYLYDDDGLFAPSEDGGADSMLRFQAGDGVEPGTYTIAVGFVTDDGETLGARVSELEVPDFDASGVQISSLTLATLLEETDQGGGELKRPYILGNRKVVPRVDPKYPLNGTLTLYYQVYNASEGNGGAPNLRISYNFYQKRGSRFVKAGTAPPADGVQDRVVIYELPLKGWPKGSYKIKVTVTDNLNGSFTEREIPFQVG